MIVARHVHHLRDKKAKMNLSKYNLNYIFQDEDERDHKFGAIFTGIDPNYLPSSVDLAPTWGKILDQEDLGACVSHSVAYAIRFVVKKNGLGDFDPARLFIYYNGRDLAGYPIDQDTGMTIRDGYKSVATYSVCKETVWSYDTSKFAQHPPNTCYTDANLNKTFRYINLNNNDVQLKKCLKDGYPISFGAALFESFMSSQVAQSGIVPAPKPHEERVGGHAMTIVGYDDSKRLFKVANQWGTSWGQGGFCYIPYDYILNKDLCSDFWSPRQFSK